MRELEDLDGTALYAGPVEKAIGADMPTDKQFTSQIRFGEGYVGTLYYYDARAYDPVLGRFISPDTIVPGAGNGQAHNRYSYALNSPIQNRDPSGHSVCQTQADCEQIGSTPNGGVADIANPFPITFQGDWDRHSRSVIIALACRIEARFREADRAPVFADIHDPDSTDKRSLSGMSRPGEILSAIFGSWTLIRSSISHNHGAETFGNNTIEFYPIAFGNSTYHHPAHEFFHAFNLKAGNAPTTNLVNSTIAVNGQVIAGGDMRTDYGYQPGPGNSQFPYQQHGTAMKKAGDPCCGEDFLELDRMHICQRCLW